MWTANRMILTCTMRDIRKKLAQKAINVSLGTVMNLRPFFVTYASDKELSLCMCKLCLNTRLLYEPLSAKAKKDGDEMPESISAFMMNEVVCCKSANGFYAWSCVTRNCSNCKAAKSLEIKCKNSNELITVEQFELVTKDYNKFNTETKEEEKKQTKLTEKTVKQMAYKDLYKALQSIRKKYTMHRYQILNDKYHWPKIVSTTEEYGEIMHCDYSENMSQITKFEPQSAHFNKKAYSLHCTVIHTTNQDAPYQYDFHLSDEIKHDHAFTATGN